MAGAIVALFYFWGWDSSANLAEETVVGSRSPGLGGLLGMLVILALFVMTQVSFQMSLSTDALANAGPNVFSLFANSILPRPWGDVSIVIVVVSTIGTLEASLLVVSRTLMSMSRDQVISPRFGELHPRFLTPWFGSIVMGVLSLSLFAFAVASSSLTALLTEAIDAIGIFLAAYYGLSAFACAWYYRRTFAADRTALWLKGIWPLAAGTFLVIVAIVQVATAGWRADAVTLGLLVVGIIPLAIY